MNFLNHSIDQISFWIGFTMPIILYIFSIAIVAR